MTIAPRHGLPEPTGGFVSVEGEDFYRISAYHRMPSFFMNIPSDTDLWLSFGIACVVLLLANIFFRPLLLTLFESDVAAAQGVPVRSMNYLFFGLLILALVASLQAVGCVLSVGLLVAPAATISLLTNRTEILFWGGGFLGALGSTAALLLAWQTKIAAGPSIVIVLGGIFLLAFALSPKYGLITRLPRRG